MRSLLLAASLSLVSLLGCSNKQNPISLLEQEILKQNEPLITEILYTPKFSDTIVSYSGKPIGYAIFYDKWKKRVITVTMEVPLASNSYYEDRFGNLITTKKILAMIPDSIAFSEYSFDRIQRLIEMEEQDGDEEHIKVMGVYVFGQKGSLEQIHVTFLYIPNETNKNHSTYFRPFPIHH